ncbi:hypothetical protein ACFQ4C_19880 [Larkinella insperata]|uniref:Uncharacterized protein n=1 Tax=Larkinella insperata TaxID=332158 RepID=A0ABW3QKM5_9BACT|nr:hypothetical protein [Larkinella insperata]
MEDQTRQSVNSNSRRTDYNRESQTSEEPQEIPPLSEADTAPMFTDLGLGAEDPYNKGKDEAMDTMLYTDTHTAINTTENRSNSLTYEGDIDDLTSEIDPEEEF